MDSTHGSTASISPRVASVGRGVFALLLALFAAVLLWTGAKAIREGRYVSVTTVERTVSIGVAVSESETFTHVYEGTAARRVGAGLVSFGLLLGVWASGILALGPRQPGPRPGPLAMAGLALAVAGIVLLCPPWGAGASRDLLFFWVSVLVWIAGVLVAIRQPTPRRRAIFVAALFALTVLAEFAVPLRSSGGFVLGFAAALLGLAQVAYVYRPWRRALLASTPGERV
jgi:hypothetical protein